MWLKEHPFIAVLIGVFILIIAGATLVWNKTSTSISNKGSTWGRLGGLSEIDANRGSLAQPGPLERQFTQEDFQSLLASEQDRSYASLVPQTDVLGKIKEIGTTTNSALSFGEDEIVELLSSITPTAQVIQPHNPFEDDRLLSDIFSFVPATVAATTSSSDDRLSERQRDLFEYGNEAGSFIESFADRWGDQALVLRTFLEDKTDENALVVDDLAFALGNLGKDLGNMELIPKEVQGLHNNLATGYETLGEKLSAVGNARTDEDLLEAIIAYNESADTFAKSFVAMVTLFSVAEVKFSQDEPGKIFVFTPMAL